MTTAEIIAAVESRPGLAPYWNDVFAAPMAWPCGACASCRLGPHKLDGVLVHPSCEHPLEEPPHPGKQPQDPGPPPSRGDAAAFEAWEIRRSPMAKWELAMAAISAWQVKGKRAGVLKPDAAHEILQRLRAAYPEAQYPGLTAKAIADAKRVRATS